MSRARSDPPGVEPGLESQQRELRIGDHRDNPYEYRSVSGGFLRCTGTEVPAIPVAASGKPDKRALLARFTAPR
jgi:hypothetical protein